MTKALAVPSLRKPVALGRTPVSVVGMLSVQALPASWVRVLSTEPALAGVGAGLYYLSTVAEWNPQVSTALPAMGFNGISTALLACSNPIGTIFSSLFISYITVGGTKLSTQYYTKEIADVITALIIYLCAFSLLFKNKIRALLVGKAKRVSG